MLLQFYRENKRWSPLRHSVFFFVTAMTQLLHTLAPPFISSIHFAHLHHRCFALAQSALELQTLGNEVPMLYTSFTYLHKTFIFKTRSVCAYTARTQCFSNSHHTFECILSCPCTECKNVALGGVDTSFFCLFSTKKHTFLHFFTAFCTFLLNNYFFCGAATVGSALRTLFDCFLVVFMLKYQGGHGV